MDNRRTPNLKPPFGSQQPKATGSNSKFARPRSVRKKDANTTLSSNFKCLSVSRSTPSLNQTVRPNLDTTVCGFPGIKSSLSVRPPSVADKELEYDLAYNDYMVALMKQELTKKIIGSHKISLNSQLIIQCEQLLKLENTFKDIAYEIQALIEQGNVVELLESFKFSIDETDAVCLKYNTNKRLDKLNVILTQESNLVSITNIKLINSQEEYEKLIEALKGLKIVLEKILRGDRNFQEVNELAIGIEKFKEKNAILTSEMDKLYESNKKAVTSFLKQASDDFAKLGGYF